MTSSSQRAVRGRILTRGERYSGEVERFGGGGDKHHPHTAEEARRLLRPQVQRVVAAVREMDPSLRAQRVVFETTVLPNYLANSYYPTSLVRELGLTTLGSKPATGTLSLPSEVREDVATKALIVSATPEQLGKLQRMIITGGSTRGEQKAVEELRQFSEIKLPSADEVIDRRAEAAPTALDLPVWEAVLHPDPDTSSLGLRALGEATFAKFTAYVEGLGGAVLADRLDVVGGLTFVPVALAADAVDALARFNPLRSISPMARLRPLMAGLRGASARPPLPPSAPAATGSPEVLVFDGGVDDESAFFKGAAILTEATAEQPEVGYPEHGSAVTAAILYGEIQPGQQLPDPLVRVHHYRALPSGDDVAELYSVLDVITNVLEGRPKGQIVNLSVGPDEAMEEGRPHRWTARLDELAHQRDALFVVAAGNNGEDDAAQGLNRVQTPADMVNGLSVGACGSRDANPVTRASYSAVGPGRPGARVQPAGVEFGGSPLEPFMRLHSDGQFSVDWGTSYSAPLVTHGLGKLSHYLGSDSSAPALKAFALHFAEPSGTHLELGYGRFKRDYDTLLDHELNEATVLYNVTLRRDEVLGLALPVPKAPLKGNVRLRYTVAFMCPTEPSESVEYTKVGVEPVLRPHAAIYSFTDPVDDKRIVKCNVLTEKERYLELLNNGWRQSGNPASRSPKFHKSLELNRREQGGKWETAMRVDDQLRGSSLFNSRLDLSYISREGGALSNVGESLSVAVVVTVGAKPGVDLFNDVLFTFPELVGVELPVEVQGQS